MAARATKYSLWAAPKLAKHCRCLRGSIFPLAKIDFSDRAICTNCQTRCNSALYSGLPCHNWITTEACQVPDTNVGRILCLSNDKGQNWKD